MALARPIPLPRLDEGPRQLAELLLLGEAERGASELRNWGAPGAEPLEAPRKLWNTKGIPPEPWNTLGILLPEKSGTTKYDLEPELGS